MAKHTIEHIGNDREYCLKENNTHNNTRLESFYAQEHSLSERRTVITDSEASHYPPVAVVVCERTKLIRGLSSPHKQIRETLSFHQGNHRYFPKLERCGTHIKLSAGGR